jgi:sugar O-acyltransferase (sialic acid O-acetyltransferase NeuD family)
VTAESVQRIVIVGAGGFGREVWHWARDAWPEARRRIAGFLSADPAPRDGRGPGIIGAPDEYSPRPGEGFFLAIGIPGVRRRVAESLRARGAEFPTLIHPTAIVASTATIGAGCILCPGAIVSDAAVLGACVLMNYHSSLGHDAAAGGYRVLSPYAALGGHARVAEDVLHASVGPGRTVGARSKVSAGPAALSDAPADCIVYGVPGRVGPLIR